MQGDSILLRATLLRRYKRFLADCRLEGGEIVTAHCPNTGSMKTLLANEPPVRLTKHDNPKRKLAYTLTYIGVGNDGWALIDTSVPNRVVAEGIEHGRVPRLRGYGTLRREVPYGHRRSRIDMLLADADDDPRTCYVEVKNVTMRSAHAEGRADFPDAVTARGRKHLEELADMAREGSRAVLFYLLSRSDCDRVGVAADIDPEYSAALREAVAQGVEVIAHRLVFRGDACELGDECRFELD